MLFGPVFRHHHLRHQRVNLTSSDVLVKWTDDGDSSSEPERENNLRLHAEGRKLWDIYPNIESMIRIEWLFLKQRHILPSW